MSYSSAALATFANMLGTLDHLAGKAQAADLPESLLTDAKLAEDMSRSRPSSASPSTRLTWH